MKVSTQSPIETNPTVSNAQVLGQFLTEEQDLVAQLGLYAEAFHKTSDNRASLKELSLQFHVEQPMEVTLAFNYNHKEAASSELAIKITVYALSDPNPTAERTHVGQVIVSNVYICLGQVKVVDQFTAAITAGLEALKA